jgi:hypothetical protein
MTQNQFGRDHAGWAVLRRPSVSSRSTPGLLSAGRSSAGLESRPRPSSRDSMRVRPSQSWRKTMTSPPRTLSEQWSTPAPHEPDLLHRSRPWQAVLPAILAESESLLSATWLEHCGRNGRIGLTHNMRIRYVANELAAVKVFRVGLVVLMGHATTTELAQSFVRALVRRVLNLLSLGGVRICPDAISPASI